jgi:hypothetical protein
MTFQIPSEVNATQNNWRFCDYCFVLYWNGPNAMSRDGQGTCPGRPLKAGSAQPHQGPSWDFHLLANTHEPGVHVGVPGEVKALQDYWKFCINCFSLWWDGDQNNKGVCNSGDREFDNQGNLVHKQSHSTPSWMFYLLADPDRGI